MYSRVGYTMGQNSAAIPTSGAGLLWRFDTLPFVPNGLNDTARIVQAALTPFAQDFSMSDLAVHGFAGPVFSYSYFGVYPDSINEQGLATSGGLVLPDHPGVRRMPFPLNYQDAYPLASATLTYSAFGSVMTPWGTTEDDVVLIAWDYGNGVFTYTWYRSDNVLDLLAYHDPVAQEIQLVRYEAITTNGGAHLEQIDVELGPNPAKGRLNIRVPRSSVYEVQVFDGLGRKVIADPLVGASMELDISSIQPGTYVLRILEGERAIGRARLIVQ
ncbi:MAG: T9SS type A sorting domain-containing protein [Flavobacteriales bacterium]|nr:T9SS type A sorting domain-containing protein [Flavobacteriales bacterium]